MASWEAGNPPAELEAFCRREHARVLGALVLYTGDALLASELAQDAFVRACRDWERVSAMERPGAWIHRVAMNLANSWFRRKRAEQRAARRHGSSTSTPDTDLSIRPAVRDALATLPPSERAVLVLRYFAELTVAETAAALRIPEGTVKTRAARGMTRLRESGLVTEAEEVGHG